MQEERPNDISVDIVCLHIYTKFALLIRDFQVPFTMNENGLFVMKADSMTQTEMDDPMDSTGETLVPSDTYDTKMIYLKRLLHRDMDFMKENEFARDPLMEEDVL